MGSHAVTEASRRRMKERDHFVPLTPTSFFTVVTPDGVPLIEVSLAGRPESRELADALLDAIHAAVRARPGDLRVRQANTA